MNIVLNQKSVGLAFLLTFLFGPLGMIYSTVIGAIVMFFLSIIIGAATFGLGLFITWPVCIIWGLVSTNSYNKNLVATLISTQNKNLIK